MKPIIGITCIGYPKKGWNYLQYEYVSSIEAVGGVPLLIPALESKENIKEIANKINGLLLSGGTDVDPIWYGEEPTKVRTLDPRKDMLEFELTNLVIELEKPILGICRGAQMLNVACGGTLNQSVPDGLKHNQEAPKDYPTHEIKIKAETLLFKLIGKKHIRVNSFHHQAVKDVASGFKIAALAKDGVIEAIEKKNHPFTLGIQAHIEYLWQKNPLFKNIFSSFVKECKKNW